MGKPKEIIEGLATSINTPQKVRPLPKKERTSGQEEATIKVHVHTISKPFNDQPCALAAGITCANIIQFQTNCR